MKFDRRRPHVYWCHARFIASLAVCLPGALTPAARPSRDPVRVALWGHSLSGNLKALFDYARSCADLPFQVDYFTLDDREHDRLRAQGIPSVLAATPAGVRELLACSCVVSTHGPGALLLLWGLPQAPLFVDVWHGVGFKGFSPEEFRKNFIARYDAVLVASEQQRRLYLEQYGFRAEQLHVTGYARVDHLVTRGPAIRRRCRAELDISMGTRLVLYAPTWRQGADRNEIPFGMSAREFVRALDEVAREHSAVMLLRFHMNSRARVSGTERVRVLSQREYPETNDLLCAADVVVTDWSSIAVDCYALGRPVVFVDVPPPAGYLLVTGIPRAGALARSAPELGQQIVRALTADPAAIEAEQRVALELCFEDTLDGRSAVRYCEVLTSLLGLPPRTER